MQNIRRMCTTCCQQRVDVRNWLDSTPLEQSHQTTYETAQSYTTFHPELVGARLRSEVLVHSSCNRKQRKHEQLAEFEIEPKWLRILQDKTFQKWPLTRVSRTLAIKMSRCCHAMARCRDVLTTRLLDYSYDDPRSLRWTSELTNVLTKQLPILTN